MNEFEFNDVPSPTAQLRPAGSERPARVWLMLLGAGLVLGFGTIIVYFTMRKDAAPVEKESPKSVVVAYRDPGTATSSQRPKTTTSTEPSANETPTEPNAIRPSWRESREEALFQSPDKIPDIDFRSKGPFVGKWKPIEPKKDAKTGFVIGGPNDTGLIRLLTEINGRSIEELEYDMRAEHPNASYHRSASGFLGDEEKLLDVLADDNDYIFSMGLTHQEIAGHMMRIVLTGASLTRYRLDGTQLTSDEHMAEYRKMRSGAAPAFIYSGRRFRVVWINWMGSQYSPFLDDTDGSIDFTIVNLDTKKKLWFSALVPKMIERYGFYEGHEVRHRVDPKEIIEVLDFLKAPTSEK
jgi:hypothetical protein